MIGNTIGLHIGDRHLVAVKVNQTLRGSRITDCALVELEETGGLPTALQRLAEQVDCKGAVCLCAVSADRVSFRNLSLPFHDPKKIRQTLPFELETISPFPVENLLVDFAVAGRHNSQSEVLAASVRRAFLAEFIADLAAVRIDPEIIDVGYVPLTAGLLKTQKIAESALMLALDENGGAVQFFTGGRLVLVRSLSMAPTRRGGKNEALEDENPTESFEKISAFCRAAQRTLHAFLSEHPGLTRPEKIYLTGPASSQETTRDLIEKELGLEVQYIDFRDQASIQIDARLADRWQPQLMDGALALAVRGAHPQAGFNFRREAFAVSTRLERFGKEFRRAAVYVLIILALLAADIGVEYRALIQRDQSLDQQLTASFKDIFPEASRVVDPVRQMQVKMRELQESAVTTPGIAMDVRVLDLLEDISKRIPAEVNVRMTRMVVDQESVQLTGSTDTFNTVDAIKKALEDSKFFNSVAISSANLDRSGEGVLFELRLQRSGA